LFELNLDHILHPTIALLALEPMPPWEGLFQSLGNNPHAEPNS
jgi:hypothetical protein